MTLNTFMRRQRAGGDGPALPIDWEGTGKLAFGFILGAAVTAASVVALAVGLFVMIAR